MGDLQLIYNMQKDTSTSVFLQNKKNIKTKSSQRSIVPYPREMNIQTRNETDFNDEDVDILLRNQVKCNVDQTLPLLRLFPCEKCNKTYISRSRLIIHQRTQVKYTCNFLNCFFSFTTELELDDHTLTAHTLKKPYICAYDNCGKRYSSIGNLRYHKLLHEDNKKFKCSYGGCGNSYLTNSRLKIHLRTHTGDRPYQCEVCPKWFNESGNLKIHMRSHNGDRPFKCNYPGCKKEYKANGHLNDHIRRHMNLRPFKCDLCVKTFARKSTLRNHMMSHTGERPHQCPVEGCGKRFIEKGNMKTHMKTHERNKIGSLSNINGHVNGIDGTLDGQENITSNDEK